MQLFLLLSMNKLFDAMILDELYCKCKMEVPVVSINTHKELMIRVCTVTNQCELASNNPSIMFITSVKGFSKLILIPETR